MVLVPTIPAMIPGVGDDPVDGSRVLHRSLRGPQSGLQGVRRRGRIHRGQSLAGPAVRRRRRLAEGRHAVRRPGWPARAGDVACGHLCGRHGRPPRHRSQLVRGGGVLSIPRQGAADRLSLVPRHRIDRRVLGVGLVGDRARQQLRGPGTRARRPVRQRWAARYLRHGRQRTRMAVDTRVAGALGRGRSLRRAALPVSAARRGAAGPPVRQHRIPLHAGGVGRGCARGIASARRRSGHRLCGDGAGRRCSVFGTRATTRLPPDGVHAARRGCAVH